MSTLVDRLLITSTANQSHLLEVTLEELFHGTRKIVQHKFVANKCQKNLVATACGTCGGASVIVNLNAHHHDTDDDGNKFDICPTCLGTGMQQQHHQQNVADGDLLGMMMPSVETQDLTIVVTPGMLPGETFHFPERANEQAGMRRGHVTYVLSVLPHSTFWLLSTSEKNGDDADLHTSLNISLLESLTGFRRSVDIIDIPDYHHPHLLGFASAAPTANTANARNNGSHDSSETHKPDRRHRTITVQSEWRRIYATGQVYTIPGFGLFHREDGKQRGNLVVHIQVSTPSHWTKVDVEQVTTHLLPLAQNVQQKHDDRVDSVFTLM